MTLSDFNQLLHDRNKKGTLFDATGRLENDITEKYVKDDKKLKEEFFKGLGKELDQDNVKALNHYLWLLNLDPFNEDDNEHYQAMVIKSIEKLENTSSSDISELANFIWVLLDHMLHNWTISDEKLMIAKLREFKVNLKRIEVQYKDDVDLLYQKLGHFGLE